MAGKDSSNKNDPSNEDEDFGLPKVKFTPIGPEKKESVQGPKISKIKEGDDSPTYRSPKNQTGSPKEDKKGNGFLIVLLLLIVAIALGSIYYFGFFEPSEVTSQATLPTLTQREPTPAPQVQKADELPIAVAETETLENTLSEITGRAAAPRYFVVVGSFIDDYLAKDYGAKLNKSGNPTFLIHPYGDKPFYRLAIAQFDNVKQALEEMEGQQGNFEENLWVLKY